ncbi:unnamed protein product [Vitrella brassicaformis CCMP3155]|uniref:Uncharacterized protein n=1 Tax=Vitrella brassicaformis (strain CCMP3155) TaxID=1169540 RepID=A0A0G4GWH2_VITBC|nr:unnamed protein product [Vitrella brassicaformis CCMP3155]|eukprot:CEM35354.1 unnamed protein product [Vitrella brassicaformis CCMP3155]
MSSTPAGDESSAGDSSDSSGGQNVTTLWILDWDDTLLPSSVLVRLLGRRNGGSGGMCIGGGDWRDKQLPALYVELIAKIDAAATGLVETLIGNGVMVVIVSAAEELWLTLSAQRWMPNLFQVLTKHKIKMLSAQLDNVKITEWKRRKFNKVIKSVSPHTVVAVGDSTLEMDALSACERQIRVGIKVKFAPLPSCTRLLQELESLHSMLPVISQAGNRHSFSMQHANANCPSIEQEFARATRRGRNDVTPSPSRAANNRSRRRPTNTSLARTNSHRAPQRQPRIKRVRPSEPCECECQPDDDAQQDQDASTDKEVIKLIDKQQFGDDDEVVCPPSPPPPRPRNPQSRLDPSNKRPRMADHRQTSDSSKGSDSDRERQEGGVDAPQ